MKKEERFDPKKFASPPDGFYPVYSWQWNAPVTRERTIEELEEMKRLGIKAFYILPMPKTFRPSDGPSFMEPDYLTDAYFEEYRFALEKAREMGFTCWLYDEGGWPSGSACGKVLYDNPHLARKTLGRRKITVKRGDKYLPSADASAAFFDGKRIKEGELFEKDGKVEEYFSERHFFEAQGYTDIPDLLDARSVEYFIKCTHEKYKKNMGDMFGSVIKAVFTDEPHAGAPAYDKELSDEYHSIYGERIEDVLPALYDGRRVRGREGKMIADYYDMLSRTFCENYFLPLKKWANANGMLFSGHVGGDHDASFWKQGGYFNIMRDLRAMDVPAVDVIWRQIYPGKSEYRYWRQEFPNKKGYRDGYMECSVNGFFPRYASSAAAQTGVKRAASESFAIYGNGLDYGTMRYVVGFQAVRGINLFNVMNVCYGKEGFNLTLGSFNEIKACHADLAEFNSYVARLSYLVSAGEREVDAALYYPARDMWAGTRADKKFENAGRKLENGGISFDIIDDDVLEKAKGKDKGEIRIGNACYHKIYITYNEFMTQKAADALALFEASGGKVIRKIPVYPLCPVTKSMIKTDAGMLTVYFNGGEKKTSVSLDCKCGYVADVNSGRLLALPSDGKLELCVGETVGVLETDKEFPHICPTVGKNAIRLRKKCLLRRVNRFIIDENSARSEEIKEDYFPAFTGDWKSFVGDDFSGTCEYKWEFSLVRDAKNCVIDLGDVRCTCRVVINGFDLGKRIFSPYRYEVPNGILKEQNVLEVFVTNTPANEFYYTNKFDKWQSWQMGPYYERQRIFDSESLYGGLYGEITVWFDE